MLDVWLGRIGALLNLDDGFECKWSIPRSAVRIFQTRMHCKPHYANNDSKTVLLNRCPLVFMIDTDAELAPNFAFFAIKITISTTVRSKKRLQIAYVWP